MIRMLKEITDRSDVLTIDEAISRSMPRGDYPDVWKGYSKALLNEGRGFFGHDMDGEAHQSQYRESYLSYLRQCKKEGEIEKYEKGKKKYGGYAVTLNVDLQEYLTVYETLLKDPASVRRYVSLLHPEIYNRMIKSRFYNVDVSIKAKHRIKEMGGYVVPDSDFHETYEEREERLFKRTKEWSEKGLITDFDMDKTWIRLLFGVTDHSSILFRNDFDGGRSKEEDRILTSKIRKALKPFYQRIDTSGTSGLEHIDSRFYIGFMDIGDVDFYSPLLALNFALLDPDSTYLDGSRSEIFSVSIHSEFEIPSIDDERDLICLEGFKKTIDALIGLKPRGLLFMPGDGICLRPIYKDGK